MPQSDVLSFMSQYFWLVFTFFFFIVILTNIILPQFQALLIVRNNLESKKERMRLNETLSFSSDKLILGSLGSLVVKSISGTSLVVSDTDKDYLSYVSKVMLS